MEFIDLQFNIQGPWTFFKYLHILELLLFIYITGVYIRHILQPRQIGGNGFNPRRLFNSWLIVDFGGFLSSQMFLVFDNIYGTNGGSGKGPVER